MSTYLDASFAVSLYSSDSNHFKSAKAIQTAQMPLLVSEFCELEAINAFRLRIFRGDATSAQGESSIRNLESDLAARALERISSPTRVYLKAHQLSIQHTVQLGIRSSDLFHVAAALELQAKSFFSFDLQQRRLAHIVGLTLNPL